MTIPIDFNNKQHTVKYAATIAVAKDLIKNRILKKPEGRYSSLLWMTQEVYEDFLKDKIDASLVKEWDNLSIIYTNVKEKLKNGKIEEKDKEAVNNFLNKVEEVKLTIDRYLSLKAFW